MKHRHRSAAGRRKSRRPWPAHLGGLIVAVAVMWILHAGDHGTVLVSLVGIGAYAGIVGGSIALTRARARRRTERERENFAADMDARGHRHVGG